MLHPRRVLGWFPAVLAAAALEAAAPDTRLPEAARAADREAVNRLIAAGHPVDAAEPDGTTALHWAVYHDDLAMTGRLLDAGANVNAANRNGATPLTLACTNAGTAVVDRLLKAGADTGIAPSGAPPLLACAQRGAVPAVQLLIARGADVNAKDSFRGQTPLMWAAAENHADLVKVLLAAGAAVDARSNGNFTALVFAVRQDAREAVRLLVAAGADVNLTGPNAQDVLRLAITNRHYTLAAMLLDAGARPMTRDKQGRTQLHDLVTSRSPAAERGQPVPRARGGRTRAALQPRFDEEARRAGRRTERAHRADANHPRALDGQGDRKRRPALHGQRRESGRCDPYLLAAQAADVEAMRLLQSLGADPRLATYANNTAVMLAAGIGFVEGSRRYRPERDALEAVTLAAAAGVDVNASNANGQTALHGAVYRAANTVIRYLVEAGARTDFQDELERTPLKLAEQGFNQVASLIRRETAAALLKELGAKPTPPARAPMVPDAP